jgi:hypothetical protein
VLLGKLDAPSDSSHDEVCRHGVCQDGSGVCHETKSGRCTDVQGASHRQGLRSTPPLLS